MTRLARPLALAALTVLAVLASAPPVAAFDGQRSGFVLGFSAGFGYIAVPDAVDPDDVMGLATELKFGAGLDDRTMLHYAGKQILNAGVIQVFPMIGITHYLESQGPSPFFTAGGGAGYLAGFSGDSDAGGLTAFGGAGYEFARHWSVEVDVVNTFDNSGTVTSVLATIGMLGY